MAATGFKGIDVRQTGNQLVFRALLQDSASALLATGTTTFRLYELQSDGTLKSYDFNDDTFKTTALTTATLAATHRTGNNSTVNTGIWTAVLSTLTGFTVGGQYFVTVNNTGASPADQVREFVYGSAEGDLATVAVSTGVADLTVAHDMAQALPTSPTAGTVGESLFFALNRIGRRNTAQAGGASTITLDAGASAVDNIYATHSIRITSGTGSGQVATITGYVGATKVATITRPGGGTWTTNPDATSVFQIEAVPVANVGFFLFSLIAGIGDIGNTVWASGTRTLTSFGTLVAAIWAAVVDSAGITTLLSRLTTGRASNLDNLDIASSTVNSNVLSITSHSARMTVGFASQMEIPASGSTPYEIDLLLWDLNGNNEDADSLPAIAARDASGGSFNANLSALTMTRIALGRYKVTYNLASSAAVAPVLFDITAIVGAVSRTITAVADIAGTYAIDFTSADRTKLNQLATDYTTARAAKLDNADVASSTLATAVNMVEANTDLDEIIVTLGAPVLADLSHDIAARMAAASYVAPANPSDYARNNVAPSWYTGPDNADIVTALGDLVTLLARTDLTTALAAVKLVTDKIATMISGSPSVFTAPALANAPTGGGGGLSEADVRAALGMAAADLDAQLAAMLAAETGGASVHITYISERNPAKASLTYRVGDEGLTVQEVLRYPNGDPINLAGMSVYLSLYSVSGGTLLWIRTATVVWAAGGVASYTFLLADLAVPGSFYRRWTISDGAGVILSYPEDVQLPILIQP